MRCYVASMPEGLKFSPDADKRSLMLRAYFDLIGLPPTPEEADAFMADQSARRVREVDRSAARIAALWRALGLVIGSMRPATADSEGGAANDAVRAWAYKYRDYVIRAFNSDKPFDRFLHEQLAGDELAGPINGDLSPAQIDLLTATGFLRMAADGTGGDSSPEVRNQVVADTVKIVTSSLLGLTVACAQCHDHRYDPIPQTDYYALRAVFEPALNWQAWKTPDERQVSLYTAADRQRAAEIEAEAQKIAAERAAKQTAYMAEATGKGTDQIRRSRSARNCAPLPDASGQTQRCSKATAREVSEREYL